MDQEVQAMAAVAEVLDGLDEEARERILTWAVSRFTARANVRQQASTGSSGSTAIADETDDSSTQLPFDEFAELFAAAGPSFEAEKVLVAGYWLQEIERAKALTSVRTNKILKDLGHGMTRIDREFGKLVNTKPQLVLQLKKHGRSKQARKSFKLTTEGIRRVQEMINSDH